MDQCRLCVASVHIKRALYELARVCMHAYLHKVYLHVPYRVNTRLKCQWVFFWKNNTGLWAVLIYYTTVHCSSLIILGRLGGKPWLFTQKVLYRAEQLTSDWPAHSGLASNLWLTHPPPFGDMIQPNGLVLIPQGNTGEIMAVGLTLVD